MKRKAFLSGMIGVPLLVSFPRTKDRIRGQKDISRNKIKLSCNFYSFNQELREGEMTLQEVIDFCAELGLDAVDITGYYFEEYPNVPEDQFIYEIKRYAFRKGLDISGTGVRNNFTLEDERKLAKEIDHVKEWIQVSAKLDAPVLRIFTGRPEEGYNKTKTTQRVIQSFKDCVKEGEKQGVILVLQNHDELLITADEVIDVLKAVNSEWFGLNLDIGSLRMKTDPYNEIAKLIPYADTWQIKEHVYREGKREETDFKKLITIIKEHNYQGYLPLEVLGEGDHKEKFRVLVNKVREAIG